MSLQLALADAANNCARDGGTATITLRSGVRIVGRLQPKAAPDWAHLHTKTGWVTVLVEEIAAVEVSR